MPSTRARLFDEALPNGTVRVADIGVRLRQQLWEQMARECQAMAQHALSIGRTIPAEVVEQLDQAFAAWPTGASMSARRNVGDVADEAIVVSAPAAEMSPLASLSVAHAALAQIIAPATPEAVLLTAKERAVHPLLYTLGPLPLVRRMLVLALFSLLVLLGVSLSSEVNARNMMKNLLELEGYPLFVVEVFLVSAASLGCCFQNLQKINAVIGDGTYNPKFESTYWTRWVMGVISGIILSQLVYHLVLTHGPGSDVTVPWLSPTIGEPLLALLGGYSVDAVHRILSNTIDAFAGLFGGPGSSMGEGQARVGATSSGGREANHGVRVGPSAGW
jgi:hypothetical protein